MAPSPKGFEQKIRDERTQEAAGKLMVKRMCPIPSPLTWQSTKKTNGSNEFATTDSMDGLETTFVGTRLRVDTTRVFYVGVPIPLGRLPERGQRTTSNRRLWHHSLVFLEVISWSLFHKLILAQDSGGWNQSIPTPRWAANGHRATPARLPANPLATRSSMWSSPTTKSLDTIVVAVLWVGFPRDSHGSATCGFACNYQEPEAWTTEVSGIIVHARRKRPKSSATGKG